MITSLQNRVRQTYKLNNNKYARMTIRASADMGGDDTDLGLVYMGTNATQAAVLVFSAYKTIPTATGTKYPVAKYEQSNDGSSWTDVSDGVNLSGYGINLNHILSETNAASRTSSNNNVVKFYDYLYGSGHTGTQVLTALQNMYGSDYKAFHINSPGDTGIIYTNLGFILPGSPFSSDTSWANQNAAYTQTMAGYCDNFPGTSVDPEKMEYGHKYHLPEDGEWTNQIAKACAQLIFEENPLEEKLIFDVYVDGVIGEKGPSFQFKWRNNSDQSMLPESMISAHIWGFGFPGTSTDYSVALTTEEGITVPVNSSEMIPFNNRYAFTNEEGWQSNYVYVSNDWYDDRSDINRILAFGPDMIPENLCFFLRFDQADGEGGYTWGDLWYVIIPYEYEGAVYIQHAAISGSKNDPLFDTEVNIIGGLPPEEPEDDPDETEQGYDDDDDVSGDGPYPDPDDQPDVTDYDSEGFPGTAILTKTYKLTSARLQDVGTKLWSASYFNVLKVQSNPIENIIACRWYPMDITGGSDEGIVIGDVSIGTNGSPIPTTYRKVIGSYTYKGVVSENGANYSPGYLAQSPYTIVKLHLPYVGTVQLDASEIYNRQLHIEYIVDIITGDVLVLLKLGSKKLPYMSLSGKMGVDIPLSGTDRAQVQIANATRAMTAAIGAAGHMISGDMAGGVGAAASGALSMAGMDYSTQRVIQHSSVCASYDNRAIVMEMQVNKTYVSAGFKKYHGLPSHQYIKLSKGMGFIQLSKRAIIDVAMTDEENRMLESIMVRGCYF